MNSAYAEEIQEADWTRAVDRSSSISIQRPEIQSAAEALLGMPAFPVGTVSPDTSSLSESLRGHRFLTFRNMRDHRFDFDKALRAEFERSAKMLHHGDDWHVEDSGLFSKETLKRAEVFSNSQSNQFHKMKGHFPPTPQIGIGPDASVDLHWQQETWELLVNFPADLGRPATFYGDNYGIQKIKGSLDTQSFNNGIILWLMNN